MNDKPFIVSDQTKHPYDHAYRDRMRDVMYKAAVDASPASEPGRADIKIGEMVDAALDIVAAIVAMSEMVRTPREMREFLDKVSKDLRRRIHAANERYSANTIIVSDTIPAAPTTQSEGISP